MRWASICSGIGAPEMAWAGLFGPPQFVAEIEKFPSAVLAHHYPEVPNLGDFTAIKEWHEPIELLVGGTPCQAFSIAGKRAGLDDPRGILTLEFLALARRLRPRWLVWENVPGVLSDDDGRTLAAVLGLVGKLGYRWAYRVLDAQYIGVPQRRRRVFLVGHLGDGAAPQAVLFEPESLRGDPPPSRETGQGVAGTIAPGAHPGGFNGRDAERGNIVTHALRGEGFDASEDDTGRGTPLVFDTTQITSKGNYSVPKPGDPCHPLAHGQHAPAVAFSCKDHGADAGEIAPTLRSMGHDGSHANAGGQVAVAFHENQRAEVTTSDTAGSLKIGGGKPGQGYPATFNGSTVRRLTPRECERLQGFPDDFTLIPWRKGMAPDGPRYKAIGNSMAVPVMAWIGRRIAFVETLRNNHHFNKGD